MKNINRATGISIISAFVSIVLVNVVIGPVNPMDGTLGEIATQASNVYQVVQPLFWYIVSIAMLMAAVFLALFFNSKSGVVGSGFYIFAAISLFVIGFIDFLIYKNVDSVDFVNGLINYRAHFMSILGLMDGLATFFFCYAIKQRFKKSKGLFIIGLISAILYFCGSFTMLFNISVPVMALVYLLGFVLNIIWFLCLGIKILKEKSTH